MSNGLRIEMTRLHGVLKDGTSHVNPEFDWGSSTIKSFEVDVVWSQYNTDGSVRAAVTSDEV